MGQVSVSMIHILEGCSWGSFSSNEGQLCAISHVDGHDEASSNTHALRVYHSIAVHGGNGRVYGISTHQHHISKYKIIQKCLLNFMRTYFPILAQGMESTDTAAYSYCPMREGLGSGSTLGSGVSGGGRCPNRLHPPLECSMTGANSGTDSICSGRTISNM